MRMLNLVAAVLVAVGCLGCASKDVVLPSELAAALQTSRVINLATNKTLSVEQFLQELDGVDVLLVGESHLNIQHKVAEMLLINELTSRRKVDVAFEMIASSKQVLIDQAYAQKLPSRKLLDAIEWDKRWDERHYGEVVRLAYEKGRLKGANLNRSEVETIILGAQEIKGRLSTTTQVKQRLANLILATHDNVGEEFRDKLVQAQLYKDRRMADVLKKSKNFVILIAGGYHTHKNIGVLLHLADFQSTKKAKVLLLGGGESGSLGENLGGSLGEVADYYWEFDLTKERG